MKNQSNDTKPNTDSERGLHPLQIDVRANADTYARFLAANGLINHSSFSLVCLALESRGFFANLTKACKERDGMESKAKNLPYVLDVLVK